MLQKGTAVLVDRSGVPRARCKCGKPLIAPTPSSTTPKYVGKKWPDFIVYDTDGSGIAALEQAILTFSQNP